MSWHFSLVAVEALSALNLLDTESCAQLKSMRIAEKSLCDGKKTVASTHSPYGTIYVHSTATRGAGAWMLSLLASRANRLALRGNEITKRAITTFGPKQQELFPRSRHNTFCLKMCGEYANTCRWSYETCEELAIPSNDLPLLRREAPERYISESASGYLPTPSARDGSGSGTNSLRRRERGCRHGLNLRDWFRTFFNLVYPPVVVAEYMMQWPEGWTGLEPLAMDKFRQWLDSHGVCSKAEERTSCAPEPPQNTMEAGQNIGQQRQYAIPLDTKE